MLILVCASLCVYIFGAHKCHDVHMEVRAELHGCNSLLLLLHWLDQFQVVRLRWHMPLPAKLTLCPLVTLCECLCMCVYYISCN